MWVENLTLDFGKTKDCDGEFKILKVRMQNQVIIVLKPFFSFMFGFQPRKAHNMLALMLDPRYKGLRLVINYIGKEWAFQIEGKYDKQVLFLLLVCAYKVLNPSDTCEKAPSSFTSQNFQTTNLYDCMVTNEDMLLLVVKEQLTHFKVKKVIDDECKDPLAWWRTQEGHFSYVRFVARQILGIVGS
jgi:hypothetical protein